MSSRVPAVPASADVVIIGGGIMGLSSAFELARAGAGRVVLLERDTFGAGSTCKAAGGVRANFSDEINIVLGQRSLETFERFATDFDQDIDLQQPGYLFLIDSPADVATFEANAALQRSLGVESRMIDPAEAHRLSPVIDPTGLVGALFTPRDGHCTPESVVLGYARAARRAGATLLSGCPATGIDIDGDRILAVETPAGPITTSAVVCVAGAWSKQVGEWAGVPLPVEPLRRQIIVTEPVVDLPPELPFTIEFGTGFYFHREGAGLLIGMGEPTESWSFDQRPDPAWLPEVAEAMARRTPGLADVGLARGWAGLYEMTPDHNALIGRSSSLPGFYYATGFSGHGFLMGPAVGEVVRDMVLGQNPFVDVAALSADRFGPLGAAARPEANFV